MESLTPADLFKRAQSFHTLPKCRQLLELTNLVESWEQVDSRANALAGHTILIDGQLERIKFECDPEIRKKFQTCVCRANTYTDRAELPRLSFVARAWSVDIMVHYCWYEASDRQSRHMYKLAGQTTWPEAVLAINRAMLFRHLEASIDNRVPTIGNHWYRDNNQQSAKAFSPVTPKDFDHALKYVDCNEPPPEAHHLQELSLRLDCYGMLVPTTSNPPRPTPEQFSLLERLLRPPKHGDGAQALCSTPNVGDEGVSETSLGSEPTTPASTYSPADETTPAVTPSPSLPETPANPRRRRWSAGGDKPKATLEATSAPRIDDGSSVRPVDEFRDVMLTLATQKQPRVLHAIAYASWIEPGANMRVVDDKSCLVQAPEILGQLCMIECINRDAKDFDRRKYFEVLADMTSKLTTEPTQVPQARLVAEQKLFQWYVPSICWPGTSKLSEVVIQSNARQLVALPDGTIWMRVLYGHVALLVRDCQQTSRMCYIDPGVALCLPATLDRWIIANDEAKVICGTLFISA